MKKVFEIFEDYLRTKGLKLTNQRDVILSVFLKTERHLSVDDLYQLVKAKDSKVGHTTVFRTMKLLCECGIAREVDFGDRLIRYEHKLGHAHHDHLVCLKCGIFVEALDPEIERLQDRLCKRFNFDQERHRMEIFGYCRKCGKER